MVGWVAIYFTLTGPPDAPVVLLLHGLGSSGDDWGPQVEALRDRYRVLAVDLPGHHRSARPPGSPTVQRMAAPLVELLDELAVDAAHVVGLSLGGCVALSLALDAPARVRSLVVVNAFARWQTAGVRGAARGVRRTLLAVGAPMRFLATSIAREAFPGADQATLRDAAIARIAANSRRHYLGCLTALVRFDVRDRLGEIRCPTLVVAGARDATVPFAAQVFLARSIPGARIRVVDRSGHVTPGDQPSALNRLILEHLSRESSGPPPASP